MTASTVNGLLLGPIAATPAAAQVIVTLVDYDDTPVVGFNTVDSAEVLGQLTLTPAPTGAWTLQLVPNADIQLTDGSALTAYRVTESGAGAAYTYWIIVTGTSPAWVGDLRTTLVGIAGGTAAAMAIAGALTVGGESTFSGGIAIPAGAADGDVLTSDADGNASWQPAAAGGVTSVNDETGAVTVTAASVGALAAASNLSDLANDAIARGHLGLGTGAVANIDTTAADIQPTGTAAAGATGELADAGHRHPYQPWEFYAGAYGAVCDNATDATAAIRAMIAAGFNYAAANDGYAEFIFDPGTYLLSSAPITGTTFNGSTFEGSAQLPIPAQPQAAQKLTLVFRGTREQTGLYHWDQTTPQRAGTVLRSTWNAGDSLPATGEASVLGGPTPHFMSDPPSSWSNVLPVIDGISIEIPPTINICGFDFRCVAEANVINAGVLALSTGTGAPPIPQPQWSFGLAMPVANNNDNCNIGMYSCEGLVVGLQVYEHVHGDSIRLINCFDGLVCFSSSGFPHRNQFDYVSIENCTQTIVLNGGFNKLDVTCADIEWGTGAIVKDASTSPALGRIGITSNGDSGATLNAAMNTGATAVVATNGALALEITNLDQALGPVTPPAVPASTTALVNPFWREAAIQIVGGAVTEVAIDGVNQLSTSGAFTLPSGHSITLTYSVAPTWAWTLTR